MLNLYTISRTHLSYLDIIRVLEGGGQLLPGWGHGFAVPAPWGKELHKVGAWSEKTEAGLQRQTADAPTSDQPLPASAYHMYVSGVLIWWITLITSTENSKRAAR